MFTLLGVLLGFYLAKYQNVNVKIGQVVKNIKKPKSFGTPFVVRPNEVALEKAQQKEKDKERIELKEIIK